MYAQLPCSQTKELDRKRKFDKKRYCGTINLLL